MRTFATLIVACFIPFLFTSEAWGVADDATKHPVVKSPLYPASETMHPYQIQLMGGRGTGIRVFANEVDAQLPGVQIFNQGKCKDRPRATCVRIVKTHYGVGKAYAFATYPDYQERRITINLDMPHDNLYAVMAHEFGHVLGLGHHAERNGVCGGRPDKVHLSRSEIKALRAAYPVYG